MDQNVDGMWRPPEGQDSDSRVNPESSWVQTWIIVSNLSCYY